MLRELAADLWVTEKPLRFFGLELGSRMTVVRLGDGSLFVHSPVALDAELKEELDRLGKVSYVVAPNRFHHLHAAEFKEAWPEARLCAAPGLETKRADVRWDEVLGDEPPEAWAGELGQVRVRGVPLVNEVVFLHRASRTLIAADLAFQFDEQSAPLTRIAFRFSGAYKRLAPTVLERLTTRDRHETRESLERILA